MDAGRGRLSILASLILLLGLMAFIAAWGFYYISLKRNELNLARESAPERQVVVGRHLQVAEQDSAMASSVRKIRTALLEKMPGGETMRFHTVFQSLELAVRENRIKKEEFKELPTLLRMAVADGVISNEELDIILDVLEKSIIPPAELR